MPALRGVAVRFQFLRLAALEKPFPLERNQPPQAFPRVEMVDVPSLVRDYRALLRFGKQMEGFADLDRTPQCRARDHRGPIAGSATESG